MNQANMVSNPGFDDHGNYANNGDLHRASEKFDDMIPRMLAHLRATFPEYDFSPERKVYSGGRSLTMKVIAGPAGLGDKHVANDFLQKVKTEMNRFDRSQGNIYSDYHSGSFFGFAEVDARYHAQHAQIEEGTEVESRMSLSAFKKAIKTGDRIVLESTNQPYAAQMVGIERQIIQVRSGDFIVGGTDGKKSYFSYPKSAAFACDGERLRISDASEHQPDAYRLYRWVRS